MGLGPVARPVTDDGTDDLREAPQRGVLFAVKGLIAAVGGRAVVRPSVDKGGTIAVRLLIVRRAAVDVVPRTVRWVAAGLADVDGRWAASVAPGVMATAVVGVMA